MSVAARTKVKPPSSISVSYSVVSQGVFVAKIGWTPNPSAWPTRYYVLYEGDDEIATSLTATTYRYTGVLEGGEYHFSVATVNVNEIEGGQTPDQLLEIPSYPVWQAGWSLSIEQNSTASVAVRASDPDGDDLTFSRQGGTAPVGVTVSSAGVVSVGSSAGGSYTLIIRATNAALSSDTTVQLTVIAIMVAPGPPINFVATPSSSSSIDLGWQKALSGADPTDYDLDYSTVGLSGPWTSIPNDGTATTNQLSGLSAGTYYFRVRANNGALSSAYTTTSASIAADTTRTVFAAATFDAGDVENNPSSITDTFRRMNSGLQMESAEINQTGVSDGIQTTQGRGLFGPNSIYDVRCVQSDTIVVPGEPNEIVTPRAGPYFLRSEIFRGANPDDGNTMGGTTKHYDLLNGASTHLTTKCKPRSQFQMSTDAYWIPYDTRFWKGISYYLPLTDEAGSSSQENNGPQLFENNLQADANSTGIDFWCMVPRRSTGWLDATSTTNPFSMPLVANGITANWWCVRFGINPNSHLQEQANGQWLKVALAPVAPDLGKWTDFVFEICYNPFSTAQTVNGWTFRANTGRLRIWKSTGNVDGNGNRTISESSPILSMVNQPFGLRPRDSTTCPRWQQKHYCFFLRGTVDTNRTHPMYLGVDEIRLGYAENRNAGGPTIYRNMVSTYQGGIATGFNDVVPRK